MDLFKRKGKVMNFRLKINCENAAFENFERELTFILDRVAQSYAGRFPGDYIPMGEGDWKNILDSNGNIVGYYGFDEKEEK